MHQSFSSPSGIFFQLLSNSEIKIEMKIAMRVNIIIIIIIIFFYLFYLFTLNISGEVFTVEVALDLRGLNSLISQRKRVSHIIIKQCPCNNFLRCFDSLCVWLFRILWRCDSVSQSLQFFLYCYILSTSYTIMLKQFCLYFLHYLILPLHHYTILYLNHNLIPLIYYCHYFNNYPYIYLNISL